MAIDPEIRDQAYQFFIEEAPELLQTLEAGLLTLSQDYSTQELHTLMRAAHTLKGGAASVGLEAIATLSHRLENILKALYGDAITIDHDLENQLLQAYDCVRLPLMEQIETGSFNAEYALEVAEPIFNQIETRCGDALMQTESYIPSSADLGFDLVSSILEVDVVEGLERLRSIAANPLQYEVIGELRAQLEVFAGFAELLNLPEFGLVAVAVQQALDAQPHRIADILNLAIEAFEQQRQAVLSGDRSSDVAISDALKMLTEPLPAEDFAAALTEPDAETANAEMANPLAATAIPLLEDLFGEASFAADSTLDADYLAAEAAARIDDWIDEESEPAEDLSADLSTDAANIHADAEWIDDDRTAGIHAEMNAGMNPGANAGISDVKDFDLESHFVTPNLETSGSEISYVETSEAEQDVADNVAAALDSESDLEILEITAVSDGTYVDQRTAPELIDRLTEIAASDLVGIDALDADIIDDVDAIDHELENVLDIESANLTSLNITPQTDAIAQADAASGLVSRREVLPGQRTAPADRARARSAAQTETSQTAPLTIRVDSDRLERMNNLVGELSINHNSLSLQGEQVQKTLRTLLDRFARFQTIVNQVQTFSDQMLVAPEYNPQAVGTFSQSARALASEPAASVPITSAMTPVAVEFDSLEMDRYGSLYSQLQTILEEMVQLEEAVEDVTLFARQSNQMLEQQRPMLSQLRDELIWARMLPLGEVLNRFPRMLRDLSATHRKPVTLKITGAEVLIDRAILEKLHDPLLHLLRNAFDHGVEPPEVRAQRGKPEQGEIEIRAYHKGNQTVIELRDDGQGLNLDRIRSRVFDLGWRSAQQLAVMPAAELLEFIFEPGFSTASQVSQLSGRGVGLDVVRSQLQAVKGTVTVTSLPGTGTTFTLRLPLVLTMTNLVICLANSLPVALATDSIEEILTPEPSQIRQSGSQQFLYWQQQIIPVYRLAHLLEYACPVPERLPSKVLASVAPPATWALPVLILRQEQQVFALEVDRVVIDQELVIKPFGGAVAAPGYTYGCTVLADGTLVPVIDGLTLLSYTAQTKEPEATQETIDSEPMLPQSPPPLSISTIQTPTILVVDDAVTLRRTLALSLERASFRVLQARDGQEAIDQLQQSSSVRLIVCDLEMPNMNGFEFLNHRRQNPQLAAIPVVILTSRSNEKHRWLAMQLGATAYFTKPYVEQEFLTALKEMMR